MAEQWYYMRGSERVGPMSIEQLRDAAQRGEITPVTYVWNEQMTDWTPAGDVGGLLDEPAATPAAPAQPHVAYAISTESTPGFGMAVASLVTGILSSSSCCCCLGWTSAVAAVITGVMSLKKGAQGGAKVMAMIGIALGGLAILWSIVMAILTVVTDGQGYRWSTTGPMTP